MAKIEQRTASAVSFFDSFKRSVQRGAQTAVGKALDAASYVLFTTTMVKGNSVYAQFRLPEDHIIRGRDVDEPYKGEDFPEYYDTSHQVTLYHPVKPGDPKGDIFLYAYNEVDHASCTLRKIGDHGRSGQDDLRTVPVRIALDGVLQEIKGDYPSWDIKERQKLQAWIGGNTFEEREQAYGDATVTWTPPPGAAR